MLLHLFSLLSVVIVRQPEPRRQPVEPYVVIRLCSVISTASDCYV